MYSAGAKRSMWNYMFYLLDFCNLISFFTVSSFLDYDAENPRIMTKCEHHFHMSCILEWMERSDTCAICDQVCRWVRRCLVDFFFLVFYCHNMISSLISTYCHKISLTFHFTSKADQARDPKCFSICFPYFAYYACVHGVNINFPFFLQIMMIDMYNMVASDESF